MLFRSSLYVLILAFVGLVMLPACGPRYNRRPLLPLSKRTADFEAVKQQVMIRARKLDREDADYVFDGRADRLYRGAKPIVVIQLSVLNQGKRAYALSCEGISLPQVPIKTIHYLLSTSSFGQFFNNYFTGLAGGLLIGIPVMALTGSSRLGGAIIGLGSDIGLVSGICGGIESSIANDVLAQDLFEKSLVYPIVLYPSEHKDVLLFVERKSSRPCFDVVLANHDEVGNDLTFHIELRPNYAPARVRDF